ncbi:hypothetical protein FOA43_004211 [Brettanomyces nanus]|uniref:tRNA-splicing endonuclease subunit Sen2 n=1 Tax=Eeniella nana TaxID=13502 RepID=A0A875RXD1_EENNA|nr:uncharacterized protein FOA43_004211 [Brettanomyces nanus]QPG76817.1 hypothetical protein FOA43_004211 [Brettanomyces nanus]
MSTKNSRESLNKFTKPLPIEIIQLPPVYPGNPISWLIATCSFIGQLIVKQSRKITVLYNQDEFCFKVTDKEDMDYLWKSGFYGKGSLSRSEPTWQTRAQKRILGVEKTETTSEEIVRYRRQLRNDYKQKRNKMLALERQYKLQGDSEKLKQLEVVRQKLSEQRDMISHSRPPERKDIEPQELRPEDRELIIDSKHIKNIEYMELTACEVLFLLYMGAIKVDSPDTGKQFTTIQLLRYLVNMFGAVEADNMFLIQFAVYFHYKSLGWCVKSGLKFSSDFVLYQRGPPFHHAAFAVTILKNSSINALKNWTHFGSIFRVVSAVKKTMVLCYIDTPTSNQLVDLWKTLDDNDNEGLINLVNMYSIREIIYKRWTPNRTRL